MAVQLDGSPSLDMRGILDRPRSIGDGLSFCADVRAMRPREPSSREHLLAMLLERSAEGPALAKRTATCGSPLSTLRVEEDKVRTLVTPLFV